VDLDVAIIGCGRVGLPLALAFADHGLSVIGVDKAADRLGAVRSGRMPFAEPGAQDVLERVDVLWTDQLAEAARARHIVITLGTPTFSHIEIDLSDIRSVLDDLLPLLRPGHALTLRSTIAPRTTEFVAGYLAKHRRFLIGEDVFVAHVPERIAAGRFFEEITTLRASSAASASDRARWPASCSPSSALPWCRPRPSRRSSRRSGRTSCATRRSRCRTSS
jgi:UDP-N-acetyl-D-mannosaminuronic acid dehydrogenase